MSTLQLAFLAFAFLAPPLMWLVSRRVKSPRLDLVLRRGLAVLLAVTEITDLSLKAAGAGFSPGSWLPMQLCDWALFAIVIALWSGWRACFEVAYFWGLGGTLQALFTPAMAEDAVWWRQCGFFLAHAGIVAGILHLLLVERMRPVPRSLVRVALWSELYLGAALAVNALTGENYGFLSAKPDTATMLDLLAAPGWLYLVQLNLLACAFFTLLYAPWAVADWLQRRGK